jgi:hypothetical protein
MANVNCTPTALPTVEGITYCDVSFEIGGITGATRLEVAAGTDSATLTTAIQTAAQTWYTDNVWKADLATLIDTNIVAPVS